MTKNMSYCYKSFLQRCRFFFEFFFFYDEYSIKKLYLCTRILKVV